jgi:lysophospholipase L1-like esterase
MSLMFACPISAPTIGNDGVHPNRKGDAIMRRLVEQTPSERR